MDKDKRGRETMKPNDRQKMCTQCDARIPISANECPYCSADLLERHQEGLEGSSALFTNQSLQTSLTSLYAPPYGAKTLPTPEPIKTSHETFKEVLSKAPEQVAVQEEKVESKNYFSPLVFLSLGANFLVLGLLQCFFSENGRLSLEWDSSYWFILCLGALPLLYLGRKKLSVVKP